MPLPDLCEHTVPSSHPSIETVVGSLNLDGTGTSVDVPELEAGVGVVAGETGVANIHHRSSVSLFPGRSDAGARVSRGRVLTSSLPDH